ncbi:hypothetical protein C1631_008780 [Chryseobacterium phosphatilyticum]|uniref:AMP-activated protein kinase glycogen-binding domain-containing protein n=1 Tax=Chryseobacterium phosphatilyticum TaxID=475075 RepID=A0A316XH15_9FLAO|nr:hypothetical protein [Chryseobacterium phosphatilyticum]PWN70080.1 hypothetical protein C1631_008780 [Chryseobacterium phosphatilyticum]
MKKIKISALFFLLLALSGPLNACTIFLAHDKKNVWIGNNEDESPDMKYKFWYIPREGKSIGYMLWSEKHEGYNDIMWQYPQGGMNEYGLFADYTAIDTIPVIPISSKINREEEVVNDILKTCKSVQQALQLISAYNLIKLSGAQLFIADASGDYATIHGNYIVTKTSQNFSLTNYCIANEHKESCWRRETSTNMLTGFQTFNTKNITDILKESAQKEPGDTTTNYSMAINLRKKKMTLYLKGDFKTAVQINLDEELNKGKHALDITSYFPENIEMVLHKIYENEGINKTISLYNLMKKTSPKKYNFINNDALYFGISLLRKGKTDDAVKFIENLKKENHRNLLIQDWLGIAYQYQGNHAVSADYFNKVLTRRPDDYLANLYLKRNSQKIVFKITEWKGAQSVKLIGSFTEWLKNPIRLDKKQEYWYAEVDIPQGKQEYKFLVDEIFYIADPCNLMYVWNGNNVNSVLK